MVLAAYVRPAIGRAIYFGVKMAASLHCLSLWGLAYPLGMMMHFALNQWRNISLFRLRPAIVSAIFVVVLLAAITRLEFLPGELPETAPSLDGVGNIMRQLLYFSGVAVMAVVVNPLRAPAKFFDLPGSLWILLLWCASSLLWSDVPGIGMRRFVLTMMVIWLAFRCTDELGYRRIADITANVCVAVLLANFAAVVLSPDAVHHSQTAMHDPSVIGAWRGILLEKNLAGVVTGVTLICILFGAGNFRMPTRAILIFLSLIFLIKTQSKTSISLTFTGLCVGGLFQIYNRKFRLLLAPMLIAAASASVFVVANYLPGYLSRLAVSEDAFTGRIQIWRVLARYINDNLWSGGGFGSFWNVGPTGPINTYTDESWIIELVAEGHNGYLDVLTQIGLLGLALVVLAFIIAPLFRLLMSSAMPRVPAGMYLALLILLLGGNFTESTILQSDQFGEFVMMLAIAAIRSMGDAKASHFTSVRRRSKYVRNGRGGQPNAAVPYEG